MPLKPASFALVIILLVRDPHLEPLKPIASWPTAEDGLQTAEFSLGCSILKANALANLHRRWWQWIKDIVNTYQAKTTHWPIIYTNRDWWQRCTRNSKAFKDTCLLNLAAWATSPGMIPGGWPFQMIWQYANTNPYGGGSDEFNGSLDRLKMLAKSS